MRRVHGVQATSTLQTQLQIWNCAARAHHGYCTFLVVYAPGNSKAIVIGTQIQMYQQVCVLSPSGQVLRVPHVCRRLQKALCIDMCIPAAARIGQRGQACQLLRPPTAASSEM